MPDVLAAARRLALDVEALLLPVACLACEETGGRADGRTAVLCEQCRLSMRSIAHPKCERCGQTLDAWETVRRSAHPPARPTCGFCHSWPPALAWAESAVWYEDAAKALVKALKYGGWRVAAGPMADAMTKHLRARIQGADLLVPIPLGKLRLRERGHNQAEILADAVGADLAGADLVPARVRKGPTRGRPLQRIRETKTQTALHPSERRANVEGAFRASPEVLGKRVVLVDDVLTTGATLCAAAEALVAAGAIEVGAITFARAAKPT